MKFLFIEPFYSGSHKAFADGLIHHSSHEIDLVTLPGENWNWRIRGSALHFFKQMKTLEAYDGIITTNLMRLSDFIALAPIKLPPVMVYFHENQLTYPLAPKEKRNPHLCMNDISTALCADSILFNSHFHKNTFLGAVRKYFESVPDYSPDWVTPEIEGKAEVIHPGCDFEEGWCAGETRNGEVPMIVWNHRWSYDKNAADFFHALRILKNDDVQFRLAVLGEHSGMIPDVFCSAEQEFREQLVCFGYETEKVNYINQLKKADIIVSTAIQENFGIAVVEAMKYGCFPLLPDRLSYPEILPKEFHPQCLYGSQRQLITKLRTILENSNLYVNNSAGIAENMNRYAWQNLIDHYDTALTHLSRHC